MPGVKLKRTTAFFLLPLAELLFPLFCSLSPPSPAPPFSSAPLPSLFPMMCVCVLLPPAFVWIFGLAFAPSPGHTLSS